MSKNTCLFPKCLENKRLMRGLCRKHYYSALKLIKKGRTSWDVLISKGWAKESSRGSSIEPKGFAFLLKKEGS